ncbi:MAG: hypothetical protein ACOX8O_08670 [Christensenellales bacterium]
MSVYEDVGARIESFIRELVQKADPSSRDEVMALRNCFYAALEGVFSNLLEDKEPESGVDQIVANNVVMELVDSATGQLYRRHLQLGYEENDNGIVLTGEDMTGRSSSIVFLSDAYLKKLVDISGQGPDEHHCDS